MGTFWNFGNFQNAIKSTKEKKRKIKADPMRN